jgi:DNA-binding GntR family transcriptional regulator
VQVFENINYDQNNELIEYSINYCRSDKLVFESTVHLGKVLKIGPKEK